MDNEDNITFETMPDFGSMFQTSPLVSNEEKPMEVEKEYDSLFDELLEKCNPSRFDIESFGLSKFNIANEIYSQLLDCKAISKTMNKQEVSEDALKVLRNRAINELGIHISTTKKFNELKDFLDPKQYIDRQPYDKELVATAGDLYNQLLNNKNDIRALEELENNPQTAIVIDEHDFMVLEPEEYLKKHPEGRHQIEVSESLKETQLQKESWEEKEEEKYYRTYTAMDYLMKYPNGKFVQKASQLIEQAEFNDYTAEMYLKHYPKGTYAQEAQYFINNNGRKYLKKYPNGRYVQIVKDRRLWFVLFLLLFLSILLIIVLGL